MLRRKIESRGIPTLETGPRKRNIKERKGTGRNIEGDAGKCGVTGGEMCLKNEGGVPSLRAPGSSGNMRAGT